MSAEPDSDLSNTAPPAPVGSGARAMGAGGAFIAIADDATSASWNPGGLVQLLYPEVSLAFTNEIRDVDGTSSYYTTINYLSASYPFSVGGMNIVTALNFQRLYDFEFEGDFSNRVEGPDPPAVDMLLLGDTSTGSYVNVNIDNNSSLVKGMREITGEVGAVSPAVAFQLTPQFSLGFTYNYWKDGIIGPDHEIEYNHHKEGSKQIETTLWWDRSAPFCRCVAPDCIGDGSADQDDVTNYPICITDGDSAYATSQGALRSYASDYEMTEKINFEGQNFNLGFLWKVTPRWTLGGVYRSEFEMDLERERTHAYIITGDGAFTQDPITTSFDDKMRFPASYGLGAAFRFSDAFSITVDATRIEWDRFRYEQESGKKYSPVNGLPEDLADIDPTVTYRLGMEYLVIQPRYVVPIRWGVFYDPEPAREEPDDYYGVTVGTGLAYDKLVLDLAYWYRWGEDVTLFTTYNEPTDDIFEQKGDITKQMVMLSAILHF